MPDGGSAGIPLLDELMADAWPPAVVERHGSWRFRWTHGVTRRANSVLARGDDDGVAGRVAAGEAFAARHGVAPVFQVSTASAPPSLVPHLVARGYADDARTLVAHAAAADVAARTAPGAWASAATAHATDAWFAVYWASASRSGTDHPDAAVCRGVLLAPPPPCTFMALLEGDVVVAVGQLVVAQGWGCVQCMATRAEHRRRGAASAVLHHLAGAAGRLGAARLHLAVMADNPGARRLYERAGFVVAHEYRYYAGGSAGGSSPPGP